MTRRVRAGRLLPALLCLFLLFSSACLSGGKAGDTRPFDYYADATSQEQAESIAKMSCVKSVFPFTLMIFQRPGYENPMMGQIALLAAPSFETLDASPFAPDTFVSKDDALLSDPDKNPVLIDGSLARAEHLSVGDTFTQQTSLRDEPLTFTVAAVFRQTPLFAQYTAVALINDQLTDVFGEVVEEFGYTNLYIKASDLIGLTRYLETEFIPGLEVKHLTDEQIAALRGEDFTAYFEDYPTHMKRMN